MPAERDDTHKIITDSVCSIISAVIVLSSMIFIIIMNGVGILSFTIGWFTFFVIILILSSLLFFKSLVFKTKNLARVNKGINYMKDKPPLKGLTSYSNSINKVRNYCPYCGQKLEPNFRFCPICGN